MNDHYPSNWTTAKLSEIGILISGQSPPQSAINHDGRGTPYVTGPEQWTGDEVIIDKWTTSSATVVPARSIFIMLRGSVVGVVFPGIASAIGRGIGAFVPYEPLNREYLVIALREICKDLVHQARGHVPGISRADLLSLRVPIPPLAEQQRIVSALHAADDLLEETLDQVAVSRASAERLRHSVLTDAFSGTSTAAWRHSQDTTVLSEQVSPETEESSTATVIRGRYALALGNPMSSPVATWRWARLAEIADLRTGHTPSRREPDYWDGDIPWIAIKDARDHYGEVIYDTSQHVTEAGVANSSAEILPVGTICLSRTAAIGYVVVTGRPMATSQDFINWTCGPTVDSSWLCALFIAERETLPDFGRGSIHKTIYLDDAERLHVLLPPVVEQQQIASIVYESLDRMKRVQAEMDRAENAARDARAAATSNALSGHLRTTVYIDEPADELLERLERDVEVLKVADSAPLDDRAGPTTERLVSTVRSSSEGLSPESLFAAAGYRKDAVDLFFAHLKVALKANRVQYDAAADLVVVRET